ncbi:MAG: GAF domain-containing sensor histidine kinase [SAR202 cluster bacterium]|nr:GAF domain-containing sensor histidine kinase [SAR202 cluster bacterium]
MPATKPHAYEDNLAIVREATAEDLASLVSELEQRKKELTVVNAIAGVAARSPEITDILDQSIRRLLEVMELEAGAVFLLTEDGNELVRAACVGFSDHYEREITHLKIGEQLTGRVARNATPIFIEDLAQREKRTTVVMRREGFRSFAGIPLSSKGRLVGVMNLASERVRWLEDAERALILSVGNQLAVAIDNAQLFAQTARLAVLEERNWLAREIHDTLAQGLVALTLQLELAITQIEDFDRVDLATTSVRRCLNLARENLEEARRSVSHLRGDRVATRDLRTLLEGMADEVRADTGVLVRTTISRRIGVLPVNLSEGLYRIAQEALANALQHSGATSIHLALRVNAEEVVMSVKDDGMGFDPHANIPEGHFGIQGMGERASLLGGRLDLQSKPGHGALVRAVLPLQRLTFEEGNP